ncbi:hypothetical protein DdX_18665 [Ditylenchus destructor]|uniref:Uncharacterized protein n=1 Tax=Ditylenchus destructor TaxID=166010 RepID=A0AAD4QXW3_9BILA|nr:hypothetical protein DdX_18665 [Ditylenchus destructor]
MERRNRNISVSNETIGTVLRHFPRKQLSQQFYLVNRNIYQVATSHHFVPNLHLIEELFIDTSIIGLDDYRFPVSYFVNRMPTPEPFVRFCDVTIKYCEDEALIEFLRNANESFIGCHLSLGLYDHSLSNGTQNQLAFLLSHAFLRPAEIWMNLNFASGIQQIMQTEGVSNCDKLHLRNNQLSYTQELHFALLSWLQSAGHEKRKPVQSYGRVLFLDSYPSRLIVDMVEHLKQAFQDDNSPPASFLITFHGYNADRCLEEGDRSFSLNKVSTGEKLTFFAKNRNVCLWRR